MDREVEFQSEGGRLTAVLTLPQAGGEAAGPRAAVVLCPDFALPARAGLPAVAAGLAAAGFASLRLDYRGWGDSGGEARGLVDPLAQADDVRAAVGFLLERPEVDGARLAVWGAGLGGGVALYAAAIDARIQAAIAVCPVGDGRRWLRGTRGAEAWARWLDAVAQDLRERAQGGLCRYVFAVGDEDAALLPCSAGYARWFDGESDPGAWHSDAGAAGDGRDDEGQAGERTGLGARGRGGQRHVQLRSAERILAFRPERFLDQLGGRGCCVLASPTDTLVPIEEARACLGAAAGAVRFRAMPARLVREHHDLWEGAALEWVLRETVVSLGELIAPAARTAAEAAATAEAAVAAAEGGRGGPAAEVDASAGAALRAGATAEAAAVVEQTATAAEDAVVVEKAARAAPIVEGTGAAATVEGTAEEGAGARAAVAEASPLETEEAAVTGRSVAPAPPEAAAVAEQAAPAVEDAVVVEKAERAAEIVAGTGAVATVEGAGEDAGAPPPAVMEASLLHTEQIAPAAAVLAAEAAPAPEAVPGAGEGLTTALDGAAEEGTPVPEPGAAAVEQGVPLAEQAPGGAGPVEAQAAAAAEAPPAVEAAARALETAAAVEASALVEAPEFAQVEAEPPPAGAGAPVIAAQARAPETQPAADVGSASAEASPGMPEAVQIAASAVQRPEVAQAAAEAAPASDAATVIEEAGGTPETGPALGVGSAVADEIAATPAAAESAQPPAPDGGAAEATTAAQAPEAAPEPVGTEASILRADQGEQLRAEGGRAAAAIAVEAAQSPAAVGGAVEGVAEAAGSSAQEVGAERERIAGETTAPEAAPVVESAPHPAGAGPDAAHARGVEGVLAEPPAPEAPASAAQQQELAAEGQSVHTELTEAMTAGADAPAADAGAGDQPGTAAQAQAAGDAAPGRESQPAEADLPDQQGAAAAEPAGAQPPAAQPDDRPWWQV